MAEFDSQVYLLSAKFIADYPLAKYPELMYKQARPWSYYIHAAQRLMLLSFPFEADGSFCRVRPHSPSGSRLSPPPDDTG